MSFSPGTSSREWLGSLVGGKYRLVQAIGEGGMGSVYRAIHVGLDREVAVKIVDLEGPRTEERIDRFLREAKLCAAVRHRYVVDIFDVDTTPSGHPYMVMELLRGITLGDRISTPPSVAVQGLVRILGQCLSGLNAVHRAGVVHRDLKPDNLFLAECDIEGIVPKIVDFGVSRAEVDPGHSGMRRLTTDGTVVGTPWYMSPEQARGRQVGPASDIYSMGVIAYEALSGRLPFDSTCLTDLLVQITTERPPPLSYYRPDLPAALSEVVGKAMARNPRDRFGSALEMRRALLGAVDPAELEYCAIVPSEGKIVLPGEDDADLLWEGRAVRAFSSSSGAVAVTERASSMPAAPRAHLTSDRTLTSAAIDLAGTSRPLSPATVFVPVAPARPWHAAPRTRALVVIAALAVGLAGGLWAAALLGRSPEPTQAARDAREARPVASPAAPAPVVTPPAAPQPPVAVAPSAPPAQAVATPAEASAAAATPAEAARPDDAPRARASRARTSRPSRHARGTRSGGQRGTPPPAFRRLDF